VLSLFVVTMCYSYSTIVLPLIVVTTIEDPINQLPIQTRVLVTQIRDNIFEDSSSSGNDVLTSSTESYSTLFST
jgi:hypothetical protein